MFLTLFLDTANIDEIQKYLNWGVISGVTTNPKIMAKEKNVDFHGRIKEITDLVYPLSVSVELTKTGCSVDELVQEGMELASICDNVAIKVPVWGDGKGLAITKRLVDKDVLVNMTCCMSVEQAILACEAGATFVSLFYRRIVDYSGDFVALGKGVAQDMIRDTRKYIDYMESDTMIICGSIREKEDVTDCLVAGADIVTVPPKILEQMPYHERTESTIKEFDKSWACRK